MLAGNPSASASTPELEEAGYQVTWIGGRNRGHDLIAVAHERLVDGKALTPTSPSEQANPGCGRWKVYCRGHRGWSPEGRTHLALVTLPEGGITVDFDAEKMTITVPVAGAEVFLVPSAT